jgi:hypothetical protein
MNWFEGDDGHWFNLDLAIYIKPRGSPGYEGAEVAFGPESDYWFSLTPAEWTRLTAQLRSTQRPEDRRPAESVPSLDPERTEQPGGTNQKGGGI